MKLFTKFNYLHYSRNLHFMIKLRNFPVFDAKLRKFKFSLRIVYVFIYFCYENENINLSFSED